MQQAGSVCPKPVHRAAPERGVTSLLLILASVSTGQSSQQNDVKTIQTSCRRFTTVSVSAEYVTDMMKVHVHSLYLLSLPFLPLLLPTLSFSVGKGKSRPVRPKEAHGGFIISNKSDGHVFCISTVDGGFQKACFQRLTMSFMSVTKDRNAYKRYVFCNDCALGHPAGLENIKSLRPLQPRSERFLFFKDGLAAFFSGC